MAQHSHRSVSPLPTSLTARPTESVDSLSELSSTESSAIKISRPYLRAPLKYIDNPAFHEPGAEARILQEPFSESSAAPRDGTSRPAGSIRGLSSKDSSTTRLLTPDQERHLFLKMNYLKCLVVAKIQSIGERAPNQREALEMRDRLDQANKVKDLIVLTNRRLVFKEAALTTMRSVERQDLVNEGFINLLASSAESFDCSRGIRFSTYAVTSLKRHYLRVRERNRNWERGLEILGPSEDATIDHRRGVYQDLKNQAGMAEITSSILNLLPPRDAQAIRLRFLEERQLKSVGEELGVSTQRAGQIIERAICRARSLGLSNPLDDLL